MLSALSLAFCAGMFVTLVSPAFHSTVADPRLSSGFDSVGVEVCEAVVVNLEDSLPPRFGRRNTGCEFNTTYSDVPTVGNSVGAAAADPEKGTWGTLGPVFKVEVIEPGNAPTFLMATCHHVVAQGTLFFRSNYHASLTMPLCRR